MDRVRKCKVNEKVLYSLDDDILFRKCSLFDGSSINYGDCANFGTKSDYNGNEYCFCNQKGIHFHCAKHPEIELELMESSYSTFLTCPKCKKEIDVGSYSHLRSRCLRALNREIFKDAQLVRVNDWYIPEIKNVKLKPTSDYRVITDVKTDKDGDTIVVLYVIHTGTNEKAQFFIKPEKMQLAHDFKDADPAKVLSKIELTLKDRKITQEYDD